MKLKTYIPHLFLLITGALFIVVLTYESNSKSDSPILLAAGVLTLVLYCLSMWIVIKKNNARWDSLVEGTSLANELVILALNPDPAKVPPLKRKAMAHIEKCKASGEFDKDKLASLEESIVVL